MTAYSLSFLVIKKTRIVPAGKQAEMRLFEGN